MIEKMEFKPHTRVYHFNNDDTLSLSYVTTITKDDSAISVRTKEMTTIIYRRNLNYCQIHDAYEVIYDD